MAAGRPFFPGSTVTDQLHLIFRTLGSPSEKEWPGVTRLPEYKKHCTKVYPGEPLLNVAPRLEHSGLELLSKFLEYDPTKRVSAGTGMQHDFFKVLGPNVHKLPDTVSIFTVRDCALTKNPGSKNSGFPHHAGGKGRRQSMLF